MLVGEYTHTLDDKKRLSLPAKFRGVLGNNIMLSRGLDGCIFVYSTEEWQKFTEKILQLSVAQADGRAFSRFMLAGATETEVDKSGRILIPDFLKDFAKLESTVVLTGVANRVEIWSESVWKTYTQSLVVRADELAERLGEIGMI